MASPTIKNLMTEHKAVPAASEPLWWSRDIPVAENLRSVSYWMDRYKEDLPEGARFDEAAIMVPNHGHLAALTMQLGAENWELFNQAEDLVYASPFGTRYIVGYTFFQHPDHNYRLEVMYALRGTGDRRKGFSPLHQALWYPNGQSVEYLDGRQYPMPHLSYKPVRHSVEGKLQNWTSAYCQEVGRLQARGYLHAQTCQSTYGTFGYYLRNDATRQFYVKPRINTRDDA